MALEEVLGQQGFNLIGFPEGGLGRIFGDFFRSIEFRERELLVANIAEYATSLHARPGQQAPYPVDANMAVYIAHKSNTLTYTCPPHRPKKPEGIRSEYIFLFTSDCWKLREILGQEPSGLLAQSPDKVWQKIMTSNWRFLPDVSSSHAIAQETVLLWSAKATILTDPTLDENTLPAKVREAARKLGVSEQAPPVFALSSQ